MANKTEDTVMVRVKKSIKQKVAKHVSDKDCSIGGFFEEAAIEKIKSWKTKK